MFFFSFCVFFFFFLFLCGNICGGYSSELKPFGGQTFCIPDFE